jgi:hypothetical protein
MLSKQRRYNRYFREIQSSLQQRVLAGFSARINNSSKSHASANPVNLGAIGFSLGLLRKTSYQKNATDRIPAFSKRERHR